MHTYNCESFCCGDLDFLHWHPNGGKAEPLCGKEIKNEDGEVVRFRRYCHNVDDCLTYYEYRKGEK